MDTSILKINMTIIRKIIFVLSVSTVVFSCTNRQQTSETKIYEEQAVSLAVMQDHPGKRVYDQYCKACHMADGKGLRGMHPPLINNKTVQGDPTKLIEVTMKGMSGKVVIDGIEYNGIMPPHMHLTDKQLADVLTYVRANFNNNAGAITPPEVAKLR
jgi:mono/diheme cytochrome c family protein